MGNLETEEFKTESRIVNSDYPGDRFAMCAQSSICVRAYLYQSAPVGIFVHVSPDKMDTIV